MFVANVTVESCRLPLTTWCFVSQSVLVCVSVTTLSIPSISHFAQCVVMIPTAFVLGTLGFSGELSVNDSCARWSCDT